jgi:glycosyltransferase involved in cell wall biosynthesis
MPKKTLSKANFPKGKRMVKISNLSIYCLLLSVLCTFFAVVSLQLPKQDDTANEDNHWKIAVIIPSCNRLHSLEDAIASVLQQTYPIFQIIVAFDSGKQCIPASKLHNIWNDPRVQFLQVPADYPGKEGPGRSRKFALENVRPQATHYALLDDDDEWFPEKTQVQVQLMQSQNYTFSSTDAAYPLTHKRCTGSGSAWNRHDLGHSNRPSLYGTWNGGKWYSILNQKFKLPNGAKLPTHITHATLKIHNIFITSSVLMARESYLGFNEQDPIGQEDYGLWLRILEKTNGLFITDPLVLYDNNRNECDDASTSRLMMVA